MGENSIGMDGILEVFFFWYFHIMVESTALGNIQSAFFFVYIKKVRIGGVDLSYNSLAQTLFQYT